MKNLIAAVSSLWRNVGGPALSVKAPLLAPAMMMAVLLGFPAAALAQDMERFDPNDAYSNAPESSGIDADLVEPQPAPRPDGAADPFPAEPAPRSIIIEDDDEVGAWSESDVAPAAPPGAVIAATPQDADASTYGEDDLIGAAEGVFGKGAEGLAKMIEGILANQGRPNAYIVGREAGGALIVGARYGSGTLHHKIEGARKVYWTGPSVGFDAGANAANTFVLVYNLYDSEELFARFPAGEGQAYFVGGLHASYLRKGDKVLIPIRVGAGLRLGVNAGYMKFSRKQRWLPF